MLVTEHRVGKDEKDTIKERFPTDIFAVKGYGVDRWQKEFFWPVSDDEFIAMHSDIEQRLVKQMDMQPDEVKILAGIYFHNLSMEYVNLLHAIKVTQQIQSKEMDILWFGKSPLYKGIISNDPPIGSYTLHGKTKENNPLVRVKTKILSIARSFLRPIIYNKENLLKYFVSLKEKNAVVICGSVDELMKQYTKNSPNWVYVTSQTDWLSKHNLYEIPSGLAREIEQFSKSMADDLGLIANKYGINLLNNHIEYLIKLSSDKLIDIAQEFHSYQNRLKKYGKKIHLLFSQVGSPSLRALSVAVQQAGGKVTAFAHGGGVDVVSHRTSFLSFLNIPIADEIVTYTEECAKGYRKAKDNHAHWIENRLDIISVESDEFFKLWKKYRKTPLPKEKKENKKVMIIGFPHHRWRKAVAGGFSLIRLDFELQLTDFLKKAGYVVLYKAHPDRIREVEGIFESRAKVIKGYFEKEMDKADVFLFGRETTSTFAPALCTNKPIIIFDISLKTSDISPEDLDLLKKRCTIISTKVDERNRIIFDEGELLHALSARPERPNDEFIEKWMFPRGAR